MKMRRNLGRLTVYVAVATLLAACSANPIEKPKNNKTVAGGKVTKKVELLAKKQTATVVSKADKKPNPITSPKKAKPTVRSPKQLASANTQRKMVYRKPAGLVRSPQAIGVRSPQPVGVRSVQPVGVRSPQPAKSRALQLAKAQQNKRRVAQNKQRANVKLASGRAVKKGRVVHANARKPVQVSFRKAVYRKPVVNKRTQRRSMRRIDPNHSFGYALSNAAVERTKQKVRYDGRYIKIAYPWGDVPKSMGVCTDVVIRSYRRLGIDLQQEVHKDISNDFYAYPNLTKWGLDKPDPNIDHRRVYNLQAFFKRHKAELPRSRNPRDYKPGDLVTWMVGPTFPHIGVVVNKPSPSDPNRLMIAHNVGAGPVIEDILFRFPMTGHYRYTPAHRKINPALHFAKTPPPPSVLRKQQRNQVTYAQLLEASKYLGKARKPKVGKQASTQTKPPAKMYLAQLDSLAPGVGELNSAAVNALMRN